jgi:hypothetical protein
LAANRRGVAAARILLRSGRAKRSKKFDLKLSGSLKLSSARAKMLSLQLFVLAISPCPDSEY